MTDILLIVINVTERIIFLLVLLKVFLSYIMNPFHPFRRSVDQLLDPLLDPIRRVLPTVGYIDFSPLVLIILVEILAYLLRQILI
jgi:YggT family protein